MINEIFGRNDLIFIFNRITPDFFQVILCLKLCIRTIKNRLQRKSCSQFFILYEFMSREHRVIDPEGNLSGFGSLLHIDDTLIGTAAES